MAENSSKASPAGIAPLANIAVAERAISRALGCGLHQPGLVVMHGPSGYEKSMAAAWVTARNRAYYVQASDFWTKKAMLKDMCRALGLQFKPGDSWERLGLTGEERIDVLPHPQLLPQSEATMVITRPDGQRSEVALTLRIDTPVEVNYYRAGGILPYVLRQLLRA